MHLITGSGRVGRLKFFGVSCAITAAVVVAMVAGSRADPVTGEPRMGPLVVLVAFGGMWLSYANSIRRLHDCGRSGWMMLLSFVPIVSLGLGLYLLFVAGDDGPNVYGRPPGSTDLGAMQAQLEQLERLKAEAVPPPADAPADPGYLNDDGTFDMDALARENPGLRG